MSALFTMLLSADKNIINKKKTIMYIKFDHRNLYLITFSTMKIYYENLLRQILKRSKRNDNFLPFKPYFAHKPLKMH